jgi:hypothetical protein
MTAARIMDRDTTASNPRKKMIASGEEVVCVVQMLDALARSAARKYLSDRRRAPEARKAP